LRRRAHVEVVSVAGRAGAELVVRQVACAATARLALGQPELAALAWLLAVVTSLLRLAVLVRLVDARREVGDSGGVDANVRERDLELLQSLALGSE
jgi:hypothetical protein